MYIFPNPDNKQSKNITWCCARERGKFNASVRVLVNDVDDDEDDDGKWRVTERVLGGDVESPVLAACTPVTRPPTPPCNQPR